MDKVNGILLVLIWNICSLTTVSCEEPVGEGLFPYILNLASRSIISVNATCGEQEPEVFCKLVEHVKIFPSGNGHCDVCDARSRSRPQQHPIRNAIDGRNTWWQSPTLTNGYQYNFVTITLDLRQVYQVAYIIIKAANSPRPGNWILEKSIDGTTYQPWQYFAIRRRDCLRLYGIRATRGAISYLRDDQVICTNKYSKLNPLENGEIFISLVNGRPGVYQPSATLLEFTSARYVRLRFQKIRTLNADLMTFRSLHNTQNIDPSVTRRYFYSVKDISIGGQCICYGHARMCRPQSNSDRLYCECKHNTCGNNCELCCPMFHQKPWRPGGNGIQCERCNCHEHADECVYNATIDTQKLSLNTDRKYDGGGVCIGCKDFTTGINCEKCVNGYYRPYGISQSDPYPCRPCSCQVTVGSSGQCITDDSRIEEGLRPGDCLCKEGYGGSRCEKCASGYYGYPYCKPCPCNNAGTRDPQQCSGTCVCKPNVEGTKCERCKRGFYNLEQENPDGCSECFCFGISKVCQSAGFGIVEIPDTVMSMTDGMSGWSVTTLDTDGFTLFIRKNADGWLEYKAYPDNPNALNPITEEAVYYWQAPIKYLGNRLTSYGGNLRYKVKYTTDRTIPNQRHLYEINLIMQSGNMTIASKQSYLREDTVLEASVPLLEQNWFHLKQIDRYVNLEPLSKKDFMILLYNVDRLLIRASYHSAQNAVYLRDVVLETVSVASNSSITLPTVEKCSCPKGYQGLSCEECEPGFRRVGRELYGGLCLPCNCNNHAERCDPTTGRCINCQNFTTGENCEECLPGYYGDPRRGTANDCKPCACPLSVLSNNFARSCELIPQVGNYDNYQCLDCREGYTGSRCERCAAGYYGNPTEVGGSCRRCRCGGNIDTLNPNSCDSVTGECLRCQNNTDGERCEKCKPGFYGTAINGDCTACNCDMTGSVDENCDSTTGICTCKIKYGGRRCDQCEEDYWGLPFGKGCQPCDCNRTGSINQQCDRNTGQCPCRFGITGQQCDACSPGYYGFSVYGCKRCQPCDKPGYICDPRTGECVCPPNTIGQQCQNCQPNTWGYDSVKGCKPCNCNTDTSVSGQCNIQTGDCICMEGFTGQQCDKCLSGFYNYPQCLMCDCNLTGTDPESCDDQGKCSCEDSGQCPCKENVEGRRCTRCKPGSFSLEPTNPHGCTSCFCFERSSQCSQAPYIWAQITAPGDRVSFDPRVTSTVTRQHRSYNVIPRNTTWTSVPEHLSTGPLYWSLPQSLLGDLTLSYNGRLNVTIEYDAENKLLLPQTSQPDIVIVGNGFQMVHTADLTWKPGTEHKMSVLLHPEHWQVLGFENNPTSRKLVMVVLQNVTAILVRGTYDYEAIYSKISGLSLDTAQPGNGSTSNPALGVEICQCPEKYSGFSCQNPSEGYYRFKHNLTIDISDPVRVIGDVKPCNCNRHSDKCDSETGICQNCKHNTTGKNCQVCSPGFFGNAARGSPGDCQPCPCPNIDNNFSTSCEIIGGTLVCTNCSEGYTGDRCEGCADGYYGNPRERGGSCAPCNCNPEGSRRISCNSEGQCDCLPGISGFKCDSCQPRYAVENGKCILCDEGCTAELMSDLDALENMTRIVNLTGVIPVPWDRLWRIKNETYILQDKLRNLQEAEVSDLERRVKEAEDNASKLLPRSADAEMKGTEIESDADVLKNNATELADEIENLFENLKDDIDKLDELLESIYHNRSGINATGAFEEAKRILKEILSRDFSGNKEDAFNSSKAAELLSERIRAMELKKVNTTAAEKKLKDIISRLNDIQKYTNESFENTEMAKREMERVKSLIMKLEDLLIDIDLNRDVLEKIVGDGYQLNIESEKYINESKENYLDTEKKASVLDKIVDQLLKEDNEMKTKLPRAEEMRNQAVRHADSLSDLADRLQKQFAKTKADAEIPLRAARVYGNIVKAVEEAENASKSAIKAADDSIRLAGVKNITDEVRRSLNKSRELLKNADKTNKEIPDLDRALITLNGDLNKVDDHQKKISDELADIKAALARLPKDVSNRTMKVSKNVTDITKKVNDTKANVDRINKDILEDKIPKFNRIRDVRFDGIFSDIGDSIKNVSKTVTSILGIIGGVEEAANKTLESESRLNDSLKLLRDKIKAARAQAEKVKVSLSSSGKCIRSYHHKTQPGVTNSIRVSFKTNNTNNNQIIFLVQKSPQEYLALELIDSKIRFSWNVGAGRGSVTNHNATIKNENEFINGIDKWYQVSAERLGVIGKLEVYPLSNPKAGTTVSGTSPVGRSFLRLNESSDLYISGLPLGYNKPPELLSDKNFTGCLGEVYLDQVKVGLHSFKTSSKECFGCIDVPAPQSLSSDTYHFDGTGFAAIPQAQYYINTEFYIAFEFKTYWRNAMLFFSGNPTTGDYIYVGIQDQRLLLHVYTGGQSFVEIKSKFTYNDNKLHSVQVIRYKLNATLIVDNGKGNDKIDAIAPGSMTGLELKNSKIYIGGVPESIDLTKYQNFANIQRTTFLGCVKKLEIEYRARNLLAGESIGVTAGCPTEGYRTIGFYGDGFALYNGQSLPTDKGDISLSFRSKQKNAVLLLAYNRNNQNFFSFALSDGKVVGKFNANGFESKTLTSERTFNDGNLHNIAMQKTGRRIQMFIDDRPYTEVLELDGDEIAVDQMYIGGLLLLSGGQDMLPSTDGLDGCVSDLIINGKIVNLNEPLQYEKADIGRCTLPPSETSFDVDKTTSEKPDDGASADLKSQTSVGTTLATSPSTTETTTPMTTTVAMTTPMDACAADPDYSINILSLVFGNSRNSYGDITVDASEIQESFQISLEFRTFFDTGSIFLLISPDDTQFVAAQIKNEVVTLFWTQNGGMKKKSSTKKVTDGRWHNMTVSKDRNRIKLQVDNVVEMKGRKIPRILTVESPMIVGSINDQLNVDSQLVRHSLRGCMRNFVLNTRNIMIADAEIVQGVTSCYTNIEPGVYLSEDSFGVISRNYLVGTSLGIEFEFRTAKQNGIIMSISDPGGDPAFTLELHKGLIKLTVVNKGRFSVSSTNSLYDLCDNQWHSVEASIIRNVVAISIDGGEKQYGLDNDAGRYLNTTSALYVGGIPGFAGSQAAAFNQAEDGKLYPDGFEGCLRNFKLNKVPIDWFSLEEQENIQRTLCPF